MQPWPSSSGTAGYGVSRTRGNTRGPLTAVERAANACNDNLGSEEGSHASEYGAVLVIDGVYTNDMNGW